MKSKPIRIVLVCGHRLFREGVREIISKFEGCELVGEAADAGGAVALAREHKPDVMLLDDASGNGAADFSCIAETFEVSPECRVVIFGMEGNGESLIRAFQCGAKGYVGKDAASGQLYQAIRSVMADDAYCDGQLAMAAFGEFYGASNGDAKALPRPGARLSLREIEVAGLIGEGLVYKEVGTKLGISYKTVEAHRRRILEKLGFKTTTELIRFVAQGGLKGLG